MRANNHASRQNPSKIAIIRDDRDRYLVGGLLAALARAEGKAALEPIRATSHRLYGDDATRFRRPNLDRTAVGLGTHWVATIFWATFFERWAAARPTRSPSALMTRGAGIALMAAVVDYPITPKHFTPGWELVLSKRRMALAYAALAGGFWLNEVVRRR